MNRMKRTAALIVSLAGALIVGPGAALAGGFSASQPGVFRTPADPWAHWGKSFHGQGHGLRHGHSHHGSHYGQFHHFHGHGVHHPGFVPGQVIVVVPRQRVFVPGQWVWNGFVWFWVPPHWAP